MMVTTWVRVALVMAALSVVACSDHDDSSGDGAHSGHSAGTGGSSAGSGGSSASGAGGTAGTGGSTSAGTGGTAAAMPTAPQLDMVEPMEGALHIMWTNKQADCDTIEGERKTNADAYAVAFTVPGEADNKHDVSATMAMTYTYRLRCKKGEVYSEYSNELSGNPAK